MGLIYTGIAARILIALVLFLGVAAQAGGNHAKPPSRAIALTELWEDTELTRGLPHSFRIYQRFPLSNGLTEQLRFYLVQPRDWKASDRRPAVVFIHGGGWDQGDPDQWFPQCRYFALRGAVGASVQYRLATGTNSIDACVADCQAAIAYLRCHAAELGVDPKRIAVVGESAGGHLAAALGTVTVEAGLIESVPDALILLNPDHRSDHPLGRAVGQIRGKTLAVRPHFKAHSPNPSDSWQGRFNC